MTKRAAQATAPTSTSETPAAADAAAADAVTPDAATTDAGATQAAAPQVEADMPAAAPKVAAPKVAAPKVAARKVAASKAAAPRAGTPKAAVPDPAVPEVAVPEVAAQEVAAPTAAAREAAGAPATAVAGSTDSASYPGVGRVLVVIPTYNEIENLDIIIGRVRAAVPVVDILVADDNSPDGTGQAADALAATDDHIHVLHRPGKQGLGAAYVAGFAWAREKAYDAVVEMDADGSHAPEELPKLLDQLRTADLVLGSRWVRGGTVLNWPKYRYAISLGGNLYVRTALGMPIKDATGGYRAYRMAVLEKIDVAEVASQGYCFQVDLVWRAYRSGFRVVEVPITFAERERGQSKMSSSVVREALWRVTVWGTQSRLRTLGKAVGLSKTQTR